MTVEWSTRERRAFLEHLKYLAARDQGAALREGWRIRSTLEWFADLGVDGVETRIAGWPRALRKWPMDPFIVYYERRPSALYVVRLHHAARRPIER
jgi:plasmid stabilization system protein ParE